MYVLLFILWYSCDPEVRSVSNDFVCLGSGKIVKYNS